MFACPNLNSATVMKCLNQIFTVFGTPSPAFIQTGLSFQFKKYREYLTNLVITTSWTTPYNQRRNRQWKWSNMSVYYPAVDLEKFLKITVEKGIT